MLYIHIIYITWKKLEYFMFAVITKNFIIYYLTHTYCIRFVSIAIEKIELFKSKYFY